ncbi:hypothetical protein ACFE04_008782 [Oxalis oulophora]
MAEPETVPTFIRASKCLTIDQAFDVMKKLPVKSLMRFKCLSKAYNEMIMSSFFVNEHQPSDPVKSGLLISFPGKHLQGQQFFMANLDDGSSSHLMTMMPSHARYVSPSINGLVYMDCGCYAIVCNPSINKSIVVPPIPCTSLSLNALGYVPHTNTYKVLNARAYPSSRYRVCRLGETDLNWRFIDGGPICHAHPGSICVGGYIYFWANPENDEEHEKLILVRFDVENECLKEIKLPSENIYQANLINFKGRLGIVNQKFNYKKKIRFWILEYKDPVSNDNEDSTIDYEWLKCTAPFGLPANWKELKGGERYFIVGHIEDSLLLAPRAFTKSFNVILFDIGNFGTLRKVEIVGLPDRIFTEPSCNKNVSVTIFTEKLYFPE